MRRHLQAPEEAVASSKATSLVFSRKDDVFSENSADSAEAELLVNSREFSNVALSSSSSASLTSISASAPPATSPSFKRFRNDSSSEDALLRQFSSISNCGEAILPVGGEDEALCVQDAIDTIENVSEDDTLDINSANSVDDEMGITSSHLFEPCVQNVIASVHLCTHIDLRKIAISARNAEYNPRKVNAVVIRLQSPKCTALVFRTGRMMITGAKSEEDAKFGAKIIAKLIKVIGHEELRFLNFKVENMIATIDCRVPVRLESLANEHTEFCSYEPELFAGLIYRYNPSEKIKAVVLIFVSGKIVITGCKRRSDVYTVFENIYPVIVQFQK